MLEEVHISSAVVHVKPENLTSVKKQIEALKSVEIYGESEEGKLVIVIETDNQESVSKAIDTIDNFDGVINAALIYHQVDTGPDEDL